VEAAWKKGSKGGIVESRPERKRVFFSAGAESGVREKAQDDGWGGKRWRTSPKGTSIGGGEKWADEKERGAGRKIQRGKTRGVISGSCPVKRGRKKGGGRRARGTKCVLRDQPSEAGKAGKATGGETVG